MVVCSAVSLWLFGDLVTVEYIYMYISYEGTWMRRWLGWMAVKCCDEGEKRVLCGSNI